MVDNVRKGAALNLVQIAEVLADADVAGSPPFAEVAPRLAAFLEGCDLAGYNLRGFDIPLLARELERAKVAFSFEGRRVVDAQVIYFRKEPRDLSAAVRTFAGREHAGAHSALADTVAAAEVLAGDLGARVQSALADSDALIVICSPEAAHSRWVNEEVLAFKRLSGSGRIYCLIVAGEPHAGDARECFSPGLRFEIEADGRLGQRPAEPIAADLRPGKDGKALARLKLVAGLLGVDLDTLRRREAQRRHRRMLAIVIARKTIAQTPRAAPAGSTKTPIDSVQGSRRPSR